MKRFNLLFILYFLNFSSVVNAQNSGKETLNGWKAGVAKVIITPEQPMAMAGFAVRNHPSEGKIHDLWAKALILQDAKEKQVVLVSTDLLGFPKQVSDNIRDRIKAKYGLNRDQVLLNSSHTHSGPVLQDALSDIYVLDSDQLARVSSYSKALEDKIVNLVGDALKKLEPVMVFAQNGVTRFQVNRRNNPVATLTKVPELKGPNDYAVPVIKAVNKKGKVIAIAFGYACHPTVLDGYKWSGDYVGFAQIELEKVHKGAVALFFQGAGADQNPLPRHTVPLAKQYGRELAAAVDRVLEEEMKQLPSYLTTSYSEINLPLATAPSQDELTKMATSLPVPYQKRWAERLLAKVKNGEKLPQSYPYPIQVWSIGGQSLVSLGGELTIGYSIKIKQLLGNEIFVFGYSNDVMSYIPTSIILKEGGYEGASAQMVYGLPSKWDTGVETTIINEVVNQAEKAGVLKK
ncbi:MAG: neutral/alkaline non-lysosomal ceramidase N-terminal domain-containing protein [Sphingobacteriaceae bacterium]